MHWTTECLSQYSRVVTVWNMLMADESLRHQATGLLCWPFAFLLIVTLLDSRRGLSEAGICSTAHPSTLRSAGDAEEVLPADMCTVQLRKWGSVSDVIVFPLEVGDGDSEPWIKTTVTGNATVAFSASALWHVYSCRTEHVVYLFLLLFNIILLKENFLFIIWFPATLFCFN